MRSGVQQLGEGLARKARGSDPFIRTMYIFTSLSWVGGSMYGLYYGIFLYRHTFSLSVLALDGLFGGVGTWLGYLVGVAMVRRYGYAATIRAALVGWAVVAFGTALIAPHIAEWFMALAVLKTIPAGLYSATCDTIMLRELKATARNTFLQAVLGIEFFVTVVLPSVVGGLVGMGHGQGYRLAFVLAGCLYALGLLVPIVLPRRQLHFSWRDTLKIFARPLYRRHAANRTAASGFNQLNAFVMTIVPFLMLKSELKVGLLTTACALAAGIVSIAMRRTRPAKHLRIGYGAYTIRGLVSLLFVTVWTAPMLLVWQVVNKLITPMHDPLQQGLDIQNDSLIMGREVGARALQINVLNNTLILIGSTAAYGAFYFIIQAASGEQRLVLQLLVVVYAAWRFINLAVSARINSLAQPKPYVQQLAENLPRLYMLELLVRSQLGRVRCWLPA